ncbi:M15 family metallopeptidase [Vibrio gazogenes]|uniref:LD-carboxypeptidase LdcB, LAS superfamily n=1 Tax=Vibrio gazogenes DSM 21264 = NBRC 103151 TaxID=1123492 RepID=A0A1M4XJ51_VIBGA|nr:M15 family metallopeptidase [Vibrio gazogenes]USP12968.1 M15 family metallopeptidase [Vibrio gazogenes]SHE93687.1 LD-carboxypeptidase LdcB, LAS superfamily [Vibrio gazogenes DSM 21264] [Vibrio gazogenes DSM 21264 = NBRC 103151]SJN58702.1 D-alanyl-D-alanine carboxypeptidase [Vibrio gazogenes]
MTPEQLTGKSEQHLQACLVDSKTFLIHRQVFQDFFALKQAADQAGFQLQIASGFRDFHKQLSIWNLKFSGERPLLDSQSHPLDVSNMPEQEKVLAILRWSALPGASRHHWGTDFDVYDRNALPANESLRLEPWEYQSGHQAHFSAWLTKHLSQFGFFLPYQQDRGGVSIEPWHISHHLIATQCLNQMSPDIIFQALADESIAGKDTIHKMIHTIYTQFVINIEQSGA